VQRRDEEAQLVREQRHEGKLRLPPVGGSITSARSICPPRSKSSCMPWSPGSMRIAHFG